MAFVTRPGQGGWVAPTGLAINAVTALTTYGPIDATGERLSFCGPVWWPPDGTTTKNLSGTYLRLQNVTKAGGSGFTVTREGVSLTAGPPLQPDGSVAQTVNIANGDANLVTNGVLPVTFSSAVSVTLGQLIAITIGFDGSGRLGSDLLNVMVLPPLASGHEFEAGVSLLTASWATSTTMPNIPLIFDDGTIGCFEGCLIATNLASVTLTTATTPDEVGMRFRVNVPTRIDALAMALNLGSGAAGDMILYSEADAVLRSWSIDNNAIVANQQRIARRPIEPYDLAAATTYRLIYKPTTANNTIVPYIEVPTATHMGANPGGAECYWTSRADAGAWTDVTTRRPLYAGWRECAHYDASGSGGGSAVFNPLAAGIIRPARVA